MSKIGSYRCRSHDATKQNKQTRRKPSWQKHLNKATLELFYQDAEKGKVKKFKSIPNLKNGATHEGIMAVSGAIDTLAKEAMTYCDTVVRTRHDNN